MQSAGRLTFASQSPIAGIAKAGPNPLGPAFEFDNLLGSSIYGYRLPGPACYQCQMESWESNKSASSDRPTTLRPVARPAWLMPLSSKSSRTT